MRPRFYADDKGRARYGCPVEDCDFDTSRRNLIAAHTDTTHGIVLESGLSKDSKMQSVEGETLVIGALPEKVTITVSTAKARREIVTYTIRMADVVDIVAGALRAGKR